MADAAMADFVGLDAGLRQFQSGDCFTESRVWSARRRSVFYDDNAWIALNFIELALLQLHGALPGDPLPMAGILVSLPCPQGIDSVARPRSPGGITRTERTCLGVASSTSKA